VLVLADEPTGQLDRATAMRVIDALLTTVAATGAALLVATHDERVANRLTTRWRMRDGRLESSRPC
jgi:predicted ABC-type transport system involved in lysophospholipase L1 biosynthesis ATPase subunit